MAMEILDAFGQLTREKAIDKSEVIELVKAGMLAAVRRNHGAEANAANNVLAPVGAHLHRLRDHRPGARTGARCVAGAAQPADDVSEGHALSLEQLKILPPQLRCGHTVRTPQLEHARLHVAAACVAARLQKPAHRGPAGQ